MSAAALPSSSRCCWRFCSSLSPLNSSRLSLSDSLLLEVPGQYSVSESSLLTPLLYPQSHSPSTSMGFDARSPILSMKDSVGLAESGSEGISRGVLLGVGLCLFAHAREATAFWCFLPMRRAKSNMAHTHKKVVSINNTIFRSLAKETKPNFGWFWSRQCLHPWCA